MKIFVITVIKRAVESIAIIIVEKKSRRKLLLPYTGVYKG